MHGWLFEYYLKTAKCDNYNQMCSIDSYEKKQKSVNKHKPVNDDTNICGARLLPSNSIE